MPPLCVFKNPLEKDDPPNPTVAALRDKRGVESLNKMGKSPNIESYRAANRGKILSQKGNRGGMG